MKKLMLDIDALQVESFAVGREAATPGTVYGHYPTRGDCSGAGCPSGYQYSCSPTNCDGQTCVMFCPYSDACDVSAGQYSCELTCGDCQQTENEAGTCALVTCASPC